LVIGIAAALFACGCEQAGEQAEEYNPNVLRFGVDYHVGEEAFFCHRFERPELAGKSLRGFHWKPPADANVQLHHAVLYTLFGLGPDDKGTCSATAEVSNAIHAYAPGGDAFEMPPGVGLLLPPDLNRIDVDTHVLRLAPGPAQSAEVTLDIFDEPAEHVAGQFKGSAKVPVIPPHETVQAVGHCRIEAASRVVGVWPHMHVAAIEFRGDVIRATGERETLIHLDPWDWHNQRIHPLDAELRPGDRIETTCVWANPTPDPIVGGNLTSEEMCEQTYIAYPAEAARCTPE
jgi:hypothetical protein